MIREEAVNQGLLRCLSRARAMAMMPPAAMAAMAALSGSALLGELQS